VQGTPGAELHPRLDTSKIDEVVRKGTDPQTDGYSGFAGTDLAERLRTLGATRVYVAGLATDYCVRATVIEALQHGFDTVVLTDAIRAVDVKPGDGASAVKDMEQAGATLIAADRLNS
jgi:nicotinamidase/pyrazinamidase